MGKKNSNAEANKKNEKFIWAPQMDEALIDAFYSQQLQGRKVNGQFTTKAYDLIVLEVREKLGTMDIDKDKVKNRMKSIKANFSEWFDLFVKNGSGFAWDSITMCWTAEPEVWKDKIKVSFKFYNFLVVNTRVYFYLSY